MKSSNQRIYSTLRKSFATEELVRLGFRFEGSLLVKRGAHRAEVAVASSLNGTTWRVTPLARHWR
jgi:hypothetical protein